MGSIFTDRAPAQYSPNRVADLLESDLSLLPLETWHTFLSATISAARAATFLIEFEVKLTRGTSDSTAAAALIRVLRDSTVIKEIPDYSYGPHSTTYQEPARFRTIDQPGASGSHVYTVEAWSRSGRTNNADGAEAGSLLLVSEW